MLNANKAQRKHRISYLQFAQLKNLVKSQCELGKREKQCRKATQVAQATKIYTEAQRVFHNLGNEHLAKLELELRPAQLCHEV